MNDSDHITRSEQEVYDVYEKHRQRRLVISIARGSLIIHLSLLLFALLLLQLHFSGMFSLILSIIIIGCGGIFSLVAKLLAQLDRLSLATWFLIAAVIITGTRVSFLAISYLFCLAISLLMILVISVLVHRQLAITLATVAADLLITVFIVNNPLSVMQGVKVESALIASFILQWSFAVVLIATANSYTNTLSELRSVRIAFDRAKRLDDLKDQFITNVNHELRNPLMTMQTYIELIRIKHTTISAEKYAEIIDRTSMACDSLVTLVQSILDTRQIVPNDHEGVITGVELLPIVQKAISLLDSTGEGEQQRFQLHIPAEYAVMGESVKIQEIFLNLLSNAVKYSQPDTPIEVTVSPGFAKMPEGLRKLIEQPAVPSADITVRDYGLGIPEEHLPLLFNRFTRLPRDLASPVVGTGLGLHLCKVFAEAMGGKIWVESDGIEGKGSTFHLQLPLPLNERGTVIPQHTTAIL